MTEKHYIKKVYFLTCKCGLPVEKNRNSPDATCFGCKQKRKREAAINYYNLKRRKSIMKVCL